MGNEDEGERERGGTYQVGTGSELSGVIRSCVRTGSDNVGPQDAIDMFCVSSSDAIATIRCNNCNNHDMAQGHLIFV